MRVLVVIAFAFALLSIAALASTPHASGGQTTTVRDGVYNLEQAKGGRAVYDNKCATCHDGGTLGPELWGDAFRTQWATKTVGAFYTRILDTMPEDDRGSLSENEVLDVVAYVLQMNEFPAGDKPIASAKQLATMTFATAR